MLDELGIFAARAKHELSAHYLLFIDIVRNFWSRKRFEILVGGNTLKRHSSGTERHIHEEANDIWK